MLEAPGDYLLTSRCATCDAFGTNEPPDEGGEVKYHYSGCASNNPVTGFIIKCACGGTFSSHKDHRIMSKDPLTVTPSWLCPKGCHVFITNGVFA
jgi:hypothetical protein